MRLKIKMSKKTKKLIKPRKSETNNQKKSNREKKLIKSIKILKKPIGSVLFYKPEIEPNQNRKITRKNPS